MIGRRGFLKSIGAAVLGAAIALKADSIPAAKKLFQDGLRWSEPLQRGDLFTIEGVHAVNPITYQTTTSLQRFIVTADVEAGDFVDEAVIYPPIKTEGVYQNVDSEPSPDSRIMSWGNRLYLGTVEG